LGCQKKEVGSWTEAQPLPLPGEKIFKETSCKLAKAALDRKLLFQSFRTYGTSATIEFLVSAEKDCLLSLGFAFYVFTFLKEMPCYEVIPAIFDRLIETGQLVLIDGGV
jgi:hypothetical protein